MSALLVVESHFGNTLTVARAIADGLVRGLGVDAVTLARAGDAPERVPTGVQLLAVGAPTHDLSLPKPRTRMQAIDKGATEGDDMGIREWIAGVAVDDTPRVVTFDTSTAGAFAGSAAKAAYKALRKRGVRQVERGPSFLVAGTPGPLVDGEVARADAWGAELAADLAG